MAYKRKELRVLSGSLNLLQPGDKIPATDAMQMENWRTDQNGALVCRNGVGFIAAFAGDGEIHTIAGNYIGCGDQLFRYPNVLTPIVTGMTGNPFGIASMNGFVWVMDQNVQGRDDGATFTTSVPKPPGTAPLFDAATALADNGNPDPNGLIGTYIYYVTFVTTIGETNPSPASEPITLIGILQGATTVGQDVPLMGIPTSTDPTVIGRNIYREGGTLGEPLQVGTINDNTTTSFLDTMSDVEAAAEGVVLAFNHDPPPAAQGLVGPYFGRLLAFNSQANPNRLWWTPPGQPQYWPGAALNDGQWVDVGNSGEAILQITCHARMAIIYKQYSIWRLIGDPDTGTLEIANTRYGMFGARAVANAGSTDYFAGTSGGLRGLFSTSDGVTVTKLTEKLDPLFLNINTPLASGATISPIDAARLPQCAIESVGNQVVFSYPEAAATGPGNSCSLVYCTDSQNLATLRTAGAGNLRGGFTVLTYAGDQLWAGNGTWLVPIDLALGLQAGALPDLANSEAINLFYQSRFEDCGYPDNQKVWLDLVIDAETNGNNLVVKIATDNGINGITTLAGMVNTERGKQTFPLDELESTNLAVVLNCAASGPGVRVHAIYLYYYVEARLADTIVTVPFQLGGGRVTQVKEIQVDADTSQGPITVSMLSDLPGNALAVRMSPQVETGGRRPKQLPVTAAAGMFEGRLFQFEAVATSGPFRLYSARALIRIVGTYIEAYEAAAGFVWDSMEQDFSTGITHIPRGYAISLYANPIKRAREIALQIETVGPVTVQMWSDLPGDQQAVRATFVVNTAAAQTTLLGRREVRLPLPAGVNPEIEGRFLRLTIVGNSQFKLYEAAIEILPIGVYLEAYEAAGGAVYDSREMDFGSPKVKEGREIELDIDTPGATISLRTDLPGGSMTQAFTASVATSGRQKVMLALPIVEGRLWQLIITSTNAIKLYDARVYMRVFGQYLTGGEGTSGAFWDSTELDLGTQQVKQLREVELELWAYGSATVTVYTDLPGNAMTARVTKTIGPTNGRVPVQIPLPQGAVPENYIFGRLVRVTVASAQSVKLFGARVQARAIGVYVEGYEAQQGACWDSTPADLGSPAMKFWDEVRFECDTDGPVGLEVFTELPGEVMTLAFTGAIAVTAIARQWATVPLPAQLQGRSIRLIASGAFGFRIYKAQVRARSVGRYLAQQNGGNPTDVFRTLDYDFGTERVKGFKKLELDIETDGSGSFVMTVFTNQSGVMAQVFQQAYATNGKRQTIKQYLPLNTRGRLMRVEITSATAGVLYKLRAWIRPVSEPGAGWSWADYPVEESAALPEWSNLPVPETAPVFTWNDLPVEPTPAAWEWAPFPVAPTPAEWQWAKVLSVEGTSDKWEWADLPGTVDPAIAEEAS